MTHAALAPSPAPAPLLAAASLALLPGVRRRRRPAHVYSGRTERPRSARCSSTSPRRPASTSTSATATPPTSPCNRRRGRPVAGRRVHLAEPGAVGFLDAQGRLQPLPDDVLEPVRRGNHAGDGTWVGLSGRVRVLVYNTDLVDRGRPARLGARPHRPRVRGRGRRSRRRTARSRTSSPRCARELGDDEAPSGSTAWPPTTRRPTPTTSPSSRRSAAARSPMGLVNHYYKCGPGREDPTCRVENHFFPDEGDLGVLLLVTAASVLDTTEHGRRGASSSSSSCSPRRRSSTSPARPSSTRWSPGSSRSRAVPPLDELTVDPRRLRRARRRARGARPGADRRERPRRAERDAADADPPAPSVRRLGGGRRPSWSSPGWSVAVGLRRRRSPTSSPRSVRDLGDVDRRARATARHARSRCGARSCWPSSVTALGVGGRHRPGLADDAHRPAAAGGCGGRWRPCRSCSRRSSAPPRSWPPLAPGGLLDELVRASTDAPRPRRVLRGVARAHAVHLPLRVPAGGGPARGAAAVARGERPAARAAPWPTCSAPSCCRRPRRRDLGRRAARVPLHRQRLRRGRSCSATTR